MGFIKCMGFLGVFFFGGGAGFSHANPDLSNLRQNKKKNHL